MGNQVYAPDMTKQELVAHIEKWIDQMAASERQMVGLSLFDAQISATMLKGALEDIAHLYMIVLAVASRLPEDGQG